MPQIAFQDVVDAFKYCWVVLNQPLFPVGNHNITIGTLVAVLVVVAVTRRASRLAGEGISAVMRRRQLGDEGTIASFARLTQYAVLVLGALVGAQMVGIDVGTLFTAGAVFAVGIGFALQNIAENFVSGVILLMERTLRPGDTVFVDGEIVRIRELGIRATRTETLDGDALIIPNGTLVQSNVRNYSLLHRPVRVRLPVGVAYGTDYRRAHQVLLDAATPLCEGRDPVVALTEFGDSAVVFEVSSWIQDAFTLQKARSELAHAVAEALKDADITIAFPQLDVHFDPGVMRGAGGAGPGAS